MSAVEYTTDPAAVPPEHLDSGRREMTLRNLGAAAG
jgi:hypothetical protein